MTEDYSFVIALQPCEDANVTSFPRPITLAISAVPPWRS